MRVAVIGGGVSGVTAARALGEAGGNITVSIYDSEATPYYYRPKLPDYLAGKADKNALIAYDADWYRSKEIDLHLSSEAVDIDPSGRRIIFSNGEDEAYDKLILATGSRPNMPDALRTKPDAFTVKTFVDADNISGYVRKNKVDNCTVIGGGLLGLEFASSMIRLGLRVNVLEMADRLLPRQLDKEGSGVLEGLIRSLGIDVNLGVTSADIASVRGMAIVCAGIVPETRLAVKAGLKVDRGVLVDDHMLTSDNDIYAVGDVAEHAGRIYGIVPACIDQARIAAAHIATGNTAVSYKGTIPQTVLKVAGIDMVSIGEISVGDDGSEAHSWTGEGGEFKKIFARDGAVVGALLIGSKNGMSQLIKAVNSKLPVAEVIAG